MQHIRDIRDYGTSHLTALRDQYYDQVRLFYVIIFDGRVVFFAITISSFFFVIVFAFNLIYVITLQRNKTLYTKLVISV